MPPPRHRPPSPDARQVALPLTPGRRSAPTAEQRAKAAVARRPSPPGLPDLAELTLRLAIRRSALERLTARAIREERRLEALIRELLENAAIQRI